MKNVESNIVNANGRIQKDQLFILGSAISGAPIIIGIIQLASPTNAGITAPKIMIKACIVVNWLNILGAMNCKPGENNFERITSAITPPVKNMTRLRTKYIVPMSLWLVAYSQRL